MKNLAALFILVLPLHVAVAQSTNGSSDPSGRENWLPNRGNVGIGTRTPGEALEVIGNAKIENGIFSRSLETNSIVGGSLRLSTHGYIEGSLGLGVSNPTEKLDVLGNIKVSGNISAQGLNIQSLNATSAVFNSLTVNANSIFNGKVGIGLSSPAEALDVSGNIKSNAGLFSSSLHTGTAQLTSLKVSENATFNGAAGVGQDLTVTGKGQFGGNVTVSAQLSAQSVSVSDIDVSNNVSIASGLTVTGLSQLSGGANIRGNSSMDNLDVTGMLNAGTISLNSISTTGDASIGQKLTVTGGADIGGSLKVAGLLNSLDATVSALTVSTSAAVGSGLQVAGATQLSGGATITGNSSVVGNLNVTGTFTAGNISLSNISTEANATIGQNLKVNGTSQIQGDLDVGGNIKAGIIEATEFKTVGGASPFNFENAVISQTLGIAATTVPSAYKLAVGGKIIATGIDIKIPEKWPDYVFTDGHKLLTIEEVEVFIKKNGHLPGMLPANVMEAKQYFNVGEMNVKLLEKMEEMMLYIIQLKKEIDTLKQDAKQSN